MSDFTGRKSTIRPLRKWDWSFFPRGRFNVLCGSSGCGKSVALRMFMSHLRPPRIKGFGGSPNSNEEMERYLLPCCLETDWCDKLQVGLEAMFDHQIGLANMKRELKRKSGGTQILDIIYSFIFDDLGDEEALMRYDSFVYMCVCMLFAYTYPF